MLKRARVAKAYKNLRGRLRKRRTFDDCDPGLIYKLRHWPVLSASQQTASIYRILSVMSTRPVNRRWIMMQSRLPAAQVDRLLSRLAEQGALEVTDISRFQSAMHAVALPA